jgi:hypothetical protein
MNIYELVKREMRNIGAKTPASLKRGAIRGNGGVGDRALPNLSHPSEMPAIICIAGLVLDHIAALIGSLVLSATVLG